MKKLISELHKLIAEMKERNRIDYTGYCHLEGLVCDIEAVNKIKFVELMDKGICYILKRKDISSISFRQEPYEKVMLCMKNGRTENFNVSENQEVLENLIADFKG